MPRSTLFGDAYFGDTDDLFMTDEDRLEQAYPMPALCFAPRRRPAAPASADEFDIVPASAPRKD